MDEIHPTALLPPARPDVWTGMDAQRTYCILGLARDGQAATPRRRPTGRRGRAGRRLSGRGTRWSSGSTGTFPDHFFSTSKYVLSLLFRGIDQSDDTDTVGGPRRSMFCCVVFQQIDSAFASSRAREFRSLTSVLPSALGISPAAAGARPPPPAYSAGAGVHTSHGHSASAQRCFQLLAAVPAPSDTPASVRRGTGYVTTPPATVGAWRGSLPGRTAHGKKTARPPVTAPAHGCRHLVAGSRRKRLAWRRAVSAASFAARYT
jgi:hypothetical protein